MINVLLLGSKEYPFGTNKDDDPIPSGGMETYVDDLAPELSRYCRLAIVTRRFRGTTRYERRGNIEVLRVPWIRGRWLRNPSFNVMSVLFSLRMARDADIIYSHGIVAGFISLLLGRILGRPSVYRPAGIGFLQYSFPLRQLLFTLEKFVSARSTAVIFHSEGEKENFQKFFGTGGPNGHVILTGFPVHRFVSGSGRLRKRFGKGVIITSVSRLVPVKGLEYLIEACSGLGKDFKLVIVGSGPSEALLRRLARDRGMEKSVIFTGFRRDIPDILSATDIFVVSSFSEGLPTTLLEAMAAGKACIVTDIGLPVDNMQTGLVVPPRNSDALRKAIDLLAGDGRLAARLGTGAAKFVKDNCTQEIAAKKHARLFRTLLSR